MEQIILEALQQLEKEPDQHLSFFIWILPSLNDFTKDEILQFQAGVLKLLMYMKRQRISSAMSISNNVSFARNSFFNTHPIWAQSVDSLHYGSAPTPLMYSYSTQHMFPSSSYYPTQNLGRSHTTIFSVLPSTLSVLPTLSGNLSDDSIDVYSSHGTY